MTNQTANNHVVDATTPDSIEKLWNYCTNHLLKTEYDTIIMRHFPVWYRFKFKDPKQQTMALLNI